MIDEMFEGEYVKVICHDDFVAEGYCILTGTNENGEDVIDVEVSYGIEELPESEIKRILCKTFERVYEKTPSGGDYSEIRYYKEKSNIPCTKEDAETCIILEKKMDGTTIKTTYGIVNEGGKWRVRNVYREEDMIIIKEHHHYSCKEIENGALSLCAQTLYDRCSDIDTKTEYLFDRNNADKLKIAIAKITSEALEVALVLIFYAFTHVENWFDGKDFEMFCFENGISFQKTTIVI